ncbi:hypothetical protein FHP25_08025 [Vineibacter terrae]|uniref:Cupin domain-containing protein n=1 Tax=Vineibacter terrae TaxID=2586908 RepID=A0A5C8PRE9_9HYPH|nr:hypothetical protein [Vineibacter terrae]TXL78140.1 hypothetical protein FHP25_08025 [Vineibacter terrae]
MAHIPGMSPDCPGDPGTLLFENDRIRIWELIMKPGEICNWHVHEHDHLLVVVDGATIEGRRADGTSAHLEIPDGQVLCVPRTDQAEMARNVSPDRTLRELIIDLKDPCAGSFARDSLRFFLPGTSTTTRSDTKGTP